MTFTRKKRRGVNKADTKIWVSDCGAYMVRWTCLCQGVSVTPHYHALVRCNNQWHFAGRRGVYKKLKTATQACEENHKLWTKFLSLGKRDQNRMLDKVIGKGITANRIMKYKPEWAV